MHLTAVNIYVSIYQLVYKRRTSHVNNQNTVNPCVIGPKAKVNTSIIRSYAGNCQCSLTGADRYFMLCVVYDDRVGYVIPASARSKVAREIHFLA